MWCGVNSIIIIIIIIMGTLARERLKECPGVRFVCVKIVER